MFKQGLGLNVVYLFVTEAMLEEAFVEVVRAQKTQRAVRTDPRSTVDQRVEAHLNRVRADVRYRAMSRRFTSTTGRKIA